MVHCVYKTRMITLKDVPNIEMFFIC